MRTTNILGYLAVFVAGILVGLVGTKWFLQRQLEGITLEQDITVYSQKLPVAEFKAGSRFNRNTTTERCSFEFYLDQHQPKPHEIVEEYYSDRKER